MESIDLGFILAIILIGVGVLLLWHGEYLMNHNTLPKGYYQVIVMTIVIVIFARTFVLEPTKVTSRSMLPLLQVGDYVLVKKYSYGYLIPFSHIKLFMGNGPRRGEVAVFKYPSDPSKYYIKRVVGLPGDHITYENNILVINGETVKSKADGQYQYQDVSRGLVTVSRFIEYLGQHPHKILERPFSLHAKDAEWVVPPNHYFVLGDNRDDSYDSRFLGYAPAFSLVGEPVALFSSK
jgi:signal peptidase I